MAQGDVKADIASVAADAMWAVQPPVGEHWLIKRIFSTIHVGTSPYVISNIGFELFDGALHTDFGQEEAPEHSAKLYQQELNIGVNNAVYFRLSNRAGISAGLGYSAIQIK